MEGFNFFYHLPGFPGADIYYLRNFLYLHVIQLHRS